LIDQINSRYEKYYDPVPVLHWMQQHPMVPVAACVIYMVMIGLGQLYFQNRSRWQWRYTLALWNLFLAAFSGLGMMRTLPQLIHNLTTLSIRDNLCLNPQATFGSGSTGLWVQLFVLSKFPELLDTFFIVIHKKPLIFLHWYHHITVLLYCWHSYVTTSPPGIFFVVMNYSVHASMYFYYFLMAVHLKPKWFPAVLITMFQISQMIVGVIVTVVAFYYYTKHKQDGSCQIEAENNTAAFGMYGSYLFLFLQFFIGRYMQTTGTKKVSDKLSYVKNSSSASKSVKKYE
jgi:elongation of very long chain fatty acids protein 6